jgi:hypothetical protein
MFDLYISNTKLGFFITLTQKRSGRLQNKQNGFQYHRQHIFDVLIFNGIKITIIRVRHVYSNIIRKYFPLHLFHNNRFFCKIQHISRNERYDNGFFLKIQHISRNVTWQKICRNKTIKTLIIIYVNNNVYFFPTKIHFSNDNKQFTNLMTAKYYFKYKTQKTWMTKLNTIIL